MQTQTEQISSERNGCLGRLLPVIIGLENARRGPVGGKAWFEITRHQFHFARHSQAFHGYRLVHITDLHIDNMFMTPERVTNFVE
ncbi:MAG TPA: hypothetical protein VN729_08525, partial [Ktedonobacteraceae bacterium]|nr:hypothetical protein [Ktedonobacteraceae bacterium]